jgi:hypothetical protein
MSQSGHRWLGRKRPHCDANSAREPIGPKPPRTPKGLKGVSNRSRLAHLCRAVPYYLEHAFGASFPANRSLVHSSTASVLAWAALPWPMFGINRMRTLLPAPHSAAA